MNRITLSPRPDWKVRVEKLGLVYHSTEDTYWDESVCYEFSSAEIDMLEAATNELHRISLEAVQHVIDKNRFEELGILPADVPLITSSWEREDLSLYGRFDLAFDGTHPPKMYEYNADTPTSLLEAAVIQWYWLQDTYPPYDQFNSIHEKLIARWKESGWSETVHFASVHGSEEDFITTLYMEDTAIQAGLTTKRLAIEDIGWDGKHFVDLEDMPIRRLFKLYPWEWLTRETFSEHLHPEPWQIVEPAWKMVLSNKAILPILWELFPDHPNLLPAFTSSQPLGRHFVRKPKLGREGANISLTSPDGDLETDGAYDDNGWIFQAYHPTPCFDGFHPVIGSWIVRDEAAGIGIRESTSRITQNSSRFVPHFFR